MKKIVLFILFIFAPFSQSHASSAPVLRIDTGGRTAAPILRIDTGGHTGGVRDIFFTRDGRFLVSASEDKTVRIWDVETGRIQRVIRGWIGKGKEGMIFSAALSPNNQWLAVGGVMGTFTGGKKRKEEDAHKIRLYHFPTGNQIDLFKGCTNTVGSLSFSPDNRLLASGSNDHVVRVWDVNKRSLLHELTGHTKEVHALAWLPDNHRLASGSHDITVILWDLRKEKKLSRRLRGHTKEIESVAVSPKGKFIASGGRDKTIRLWNGHLNKVLANQGTSVPSLSFAPDGKRILSGTSGAGSQVCRLYDIPTGRERLSFRKHKDIVLAVAISPDGDLAASGGGENHEIYIWDIDNGKVKHKLEGAGRGVFSVGFSGDGGSVAWGNRKESSVENKYGPLERWMKIPTRNLGQRVTFQGALKQAGDFVGAAGSLGRLRLKTRWAGSPKYPAILQVLENERIIARIDRDETSGFGHKSYTFTPDAGLIVSGGFNGKLSAYKTRTGKEIQKYEGHTGEVWAVAVSPDGKKIVSGSDDQTVRVWSLETGENLLTIFVGSDEDGDEEWVAWTRSGYYTSSPRGDKYIGWQINQGVDVNPLYHPASRFSKILYRSDIVAATLVHLSEERGIVALKAVNAPTVDEMPAFAPPNVRIVQPKNKFTTQEKSVSIKVRIDRNDVQIKDFAILVNGKQVLNNQERLVFNDRDTVFHRFNVPLNHEKNIIIAQVTNVKEARSMHKVEVFWKSTASGFPRGDLYLLAVGVNKLDYISGIDLNFSGRDARDFAGKMQQLEGKLFSKVHAYVFSDSSPRKPKSDEIVDALYTLRRGGYNDTVMIFIAGHGLFTNDNDFIFLTRDSKFEDDNDFTSIKRNPRSDDDKRNYKMGSVLKWADIEDVLRKVDSRRVVLLDTCYSGGTDITELLKRGSDSNIAVFASSSADQWSYESGTIGHGYFTYAILEGLGKDLPADVYKDGQVEIMELATYVRKEVEKLSEGRQTPNLYLPIGVDDFPFYVR